MALSEVLLRATSSTKASPGFLNAYPSNFLLYCTTELSISSFNIFRKYLLSAYYTQDTMLDATGNMRMSKIQCHKGEEDTKPH